MRTVVLLGVTALAACATIPVFEPREWNATVAPREGFDARASVNAVTTPGQTAVAINLASGVPGGTHPWHIHFGSCASGGAIVGAPDAYPHLRPGSAGTAAATALIRTELVPGQVYHVNVHLSPAELGTVLACGDLH